MTRDYSKRLAGVVIIFLNFAFICLIWYAYFTLKKVEIYKAILASVVFASGVVAGFVYFSVPQRGPGWFVLDRSYLSKGHYTLLAVVTSFLGVGALWVVASAQLPLLIRAIALIFFCVCAYGTVRYVLETRR